MDVWGWFLMSFFGWSKIWKKKLKNQTFKFYHFTFFIALINVNALHYFLSCLHTQIWEWDTVLTAVRGPVAWRKLVISWFFPCFLTIHRCWPPEHRERWSSGPTLMPCWSSPSKRPVPAAILSKVRIPSPGHLCVPWLSLSRRSLVLPWRRFGISCPQTLGETGYNIRQLPPQDTGLHSPFSRDAPRMAISQPVWTSKIRDAL